MQKNNTDRVLIGLIAVVAATGACGSAFEAERLSDGGRTTVIAKTESEPAAPRKLEREFMSVATVSERALPAVVNISTTRKAKAGRSPSLSPFFSDPFFRHFFDRQSPGLRRQPPERMEQSLGSGVIVRSDGIILTNNHVINDADDVRVTLHDRREYRAEIVGKDPPSDLAVLKLQDPPEDLKAVPFGDSDTLRLGEVVVAIGNPFGVGQTVTMGIVSAKGRANVGIVDYEDFIQTDAAINPGNSGGALLNLHGEVVGINTAILSRTGGYQGIGFAIPSNMARSIMASLIEDGRVVRGYLGVMIQDLTPELAEAMGSDVKKGVLVSEVLPDSPADKAGVKTGDIIAQADGREVATAARLRNIVASTGAGRTMTMQLVRNGQRKTVEVSLTERKDEGDTIALDDDQGPLGGVKLEPLTDELRRKLEVSRRVDAGVVVTSVADRSRAARAGLRPGDVITSVNRTRVKTPSDFVEAYDRAADTVLLRIHRRGGSLFLVLNK